MTTRRRCSRACVEQDRPLNTGAEVYFPPPPEVDGHYVLTIRRADGVEYHEIAAGPFSSLRQARAACTRIRRKNPLARVSEFRSR
jgi:hypothetical protein